MIVKTFLKKSSSEAHVAHSWILQTKRFERVFMDNPFGVQLKWIMFEKAHQNKAPNCYTYSTLFKLQNFLNEKKKKKEPAFFQFI